MLPPSVPINLMTNSIVAQASNLILALDVGTLSVRAAVYDQQGKLQAISSQPISLNRLSETKIEQNPLELKEGLANVMNDVLAKPIVQERGVAAAGLSTQRSSVVAWNRETGEPLSPVVSWQVRRAADY